MSNKQNPTKESVKDTVARLKANRQQNEDYLNAGKSVEQTATSATEHKTRSSVLRMRVSKRAKPVDTLDRKKTINLVTKKLLMGELTQGEALKELRINVLGLKQDAYASLVNVSRKTLSDVENDRGSYKTEVLNKLFKPFGLKVGLVPTSPNMLISLLSTKET